jgi:AcrR family transcriptional regulator
MSSTKSTPVVTPRRRGRPRRDAQDRRSPPEKILAVAEELVAKHGVHGFRLRDVAAQLGVQIPSLYNHFKSRDDLLAGLAAQLSTEGIAAAAAVRVPGEGPLETYRRAARAYAAYLYKRPAAARISLWQISQEGVEAAGWERNAALESEFHRRARDVFERGVRAGAIRAIRFEQYHTQLLWGVASQSLFLPYDRKLKRVPLKRLQDEVEDFVVRLLTPNPADRVISDSRVVAWDADETEN